MNPGDEAVSPATDGPVPLPPAADPGAGTPAVPAPFPTPEPATTSDPTPETVLRWIAAAGGKPWFPSVHAAETGLPRDRLDDPLNELRQTGLVRVGDWVRGTGQGYVLTDDGQAVVLGTPKPAATRPADTPPPPDRRPAVIDLRPPVVTPALILANLIWFFVGVVVASRVGVPLGAYLLHGNPAVLERLGAVAAPDLLRGDWWRLLTCCFVHGSVWHLVLNLLSLGMAGSVAELVWGRWRTTVIYLLSGFAGSCLAMALRPTDPGSGVPVILVGASGAICGLLTAIAVWLVAVRHRLKRELVSDMTRRLGLVFAVSIGVSFIPGVSWEGHLGGAVAGFVAAALLNVLRAGDWPRRVAAGGLLAAVPFLCLAGLFAAIQSGDRWAPFRPGPPDPVPLLRAIRPEVVRPETEAALFLMIRPERRTPERTAEVRGKVESLHGKAAEVARLLEQSGDGPEADELRQKRKAFAEARAHSLGLLVGMLDAKAIPEVAAWKAWGDSRREANRLWAGCAIPAVTPHAPPALVAPRRAEPVPAADQ